MTALGRELSQPGPREEVAAGAAPRVPCATAIEARASEWIAPYSQAWHLERARDWVVFLDPGASLEMRVAALTHDIERMFPGSPVLDKRRGRWDDPHYLYAHGARSGTIVGAWLHDQDATAEGCSIPEVQRLVTLHEFGGLDGADFVQAADSLSFLETLQDIVAGWVTGGECGIEQARAKYQYMADRIRVPQARQLAVPLLTGALATLARAAQ
jgi:hypothetical protein